MDERTVTTARGITCRVLEGGEPGAGPPLVFLHGAAGLFPSNPFLDLLAERFHVVAPEWPGYGEHGGEEQLEDMLDFTLHGWDVVDALGLERPAIVGHSMGGMIAAEMAAVANREVSRLVLAGAAGLWLDDHPIPDLFATLPFRLAPLLFHDPERGAALLTGGTDFSDMAALQTFFVANARRMGTAGKILFPIPNRRVSKRLYRVRSEALVLWGASDALVPPVYAQRWAELLPKAEVESIPEAGHMLPYEQPEAFAAAVTAFLSR